jgi:acyl-CoA synthetase (AMP-forming)/AMP-acid ligase II
VVGNNVNLNAVELAVKKTGLVKHCEIFGVPDALLITRIVCLFEADEVVELRAKLLIQSCLKYLYTYELPKEFIICEKIPISNMGKRSRYMLSQMYERSEFQYTTLPY